VTIKNAPFLTAVAYPAIKFFTPLYSINPSYDSNTVNLLEISLLKIELGVIR